MVFPVVMYVWWDLHHKEGWTPKNWCFWDVVLEKTLESPQESARTARISNQSILKEISPEYSLKELMLQRKRSWRGHLMWRANPLEKTLLLGKIEGRTRRGSTEFGWHHQLNGHEFEEAPGNGEGQGRLACCSPWGRRVWRDWATEQQQQRIEDIRESFKEGK